MSKSDVRITVPYFRSLKNPSAWTREPNSETDFRWLVIRLHFNLRWVDQEGPFLGKVISDLSAPADTERTHTFFVSTEVERLTEEQLLRELFYKEQEIDELTSDLSAGFNFSPLRLGGSVKSSSRSSQEFSTRNSRATKEEYKERKTVTVSENVVVKPGAGSVYATESYMRNVYDLHLELADYLVIEYRKSLTSVYNYRRYKIPTSPEDGRPWQARPNVLKPRRHVGLVRTWELLNRPAVIEKSKWRIKVNAPDSATLDTSGACLAPGFRDTERCSSLYAVSEITFPGKAKRGTLIKF